MTATLATYPFDLLRTRFAAQGQQRVYSGVYQAVRVIHQEEGIRGMYRGLAPSILQIMPYMGLVFGSYDWMKKGFAWSRVRWIAVLFSVSFPPYYTINESPSLESELVETMAEHRVWINSKCSRRTDIWCHRWNSQQGGRLPHRHSQEKNPGISKISQHKSSRLLVTKPAPLKRFKVRRATQMQFTTYRDIPKESWPHLHRFYIRKESEGCITDYHRR